MLLSAEDLKDWTGIKTRPAMKRWLGQYGVRWFTDHNGWPITTTDAINHALGHAGHRQEPDLEAVSRAMPARRS